MMAQIIITTSGSTNRAKTGGRKLQVTPAKSARKRSHSYYREKVTYAVEGTTAFTISTSGNSIRKEEAGPNGRPTAAKNITMNSLRQYSATMRLPSLLMKKHT